jgi:hypothetical protein
MGVEPMAGPTGIEPIRGRAQNSLFIDFGTCEANHTENSEEARERAAISKND